MKETYIYNYCSPGCQPLVSISELPREEAMKAAKELASKNQGTAFRRFGDDFGKWYYDKRIITEKWLFEHFITIGGKPKTKHPLYFVVCGSDYLDDWFSNGTITKLAINDIPSEDISFTFGDSMSNLDKFTEESIFRKEQLIEFLKDYDDDDEESFRRDIRRRCGYIEVQLWNKVHLKDCLCERK